MDEEALVHLYNTVDDHLTGGTVASGEQCGQPEKKFNRGRWVTLEEANLLYQIAQEEKPSHIFESGTANGYSTLWLSLFGCPVTTFDPISRHKAWDALDGQPDNITYVQEGFEVGVGAAAGGVTGKRMFFIDGLHTAGGVNGDTDAVREIISPGDVIVYHDLNDKPVIRCCHRIVEFTSSTQDYPTRRGMMKMIWGDK